jgi:hypothetical protein
MSVVESGRLQYFLPASKSGLTVTFRIRCTKVTQLCNLIKRKLSISNLRRVSKQFVLIIFIKSKSNSSDGSKMAGVGLEFWGSIPQSRSLIGCDAM